MQITIASKPAKASKADLACYFNTSGSSLSADRRPAPAGAAATVLSAVQDQLVLDISVDKIPFVDGDESYRTAGGLTIRELQKAGYHHLAWYLDGEVTEDVFDFLVMGAMLASYSYTVYKSGNGNQRKPVKLTIFADKQAAAFKRRLARLEAIHSGVCTARDLANTPGCDLVPQDLADFAKAMARQEGLAFKALTYSQLQKGGYTGLVNVGRGSVNPPVLFSLTYQPSKPAKNSRPLCLVGKGLTFDAGGINLKPFEGMWNMKADMGGAACVVGAMQAIARLKVATPVTAVIAAAQNLPDGNAYLPGDVLRYRNGRTVEIQNTDAEGRLVLADALLYAQETLKQKRIVDFATLTGACARALGTAYIGMLSRSSELAEEVREAGRVSGDVVWELPMSIEYRRLLESKIADVRNIGGPLAGAQTSAWFLHEFINEGTEYVHLDIAGTFVNEKPEKYWSRPGMTGSGTRLAIELATMMAGG